MEKQQQLLDINKFTASIGFRHNLLTAVCVLLTCNLMLAQHTYIQPRAPVSDKTLLMAC